MSSHQVAARGTGGTAQVSGALRRCHHYSFLSAIHSPQSSQRIFEKEKSVHVCLFPTALLCIQDQIKLLNVASEILTTGPSNAQASSRPPSPSLIPHQPLRAPPSQTTRLCLPQGLCTSCQLYLGDPLHLHTVAPPSHHPRLGECPLGRGPP